MSEINVTDEKALKDFLFDIECLEELSPWTSKLNIFDVLRIERQEIRHSNMLRWLLDANETHGIGDKFISMFMQRLFSDNKMPQMDIFNCLLSDFYSFSVQRESKHIDILIISHKEKIAVAIENKVDSHEHSNQLNRYRVQMEQAYPDYQRLYVYLTPDGDTPSDEVNWQVFSYSDVAEILENICENPNVSEETELLIKNYVSFIRRDIVEDKRLIEICNKIYSKHRQALELIMKNKTIGGINLGSVIQDTLIKLKNEGKIRYDEEWGYQFGTERMYKALPSLDEPISAWNALDIYSYIFTLDEDRFFLYFEITGKNIPEEQRATMNKMIDILKPNSKRDFTWKRLYRTDWFDLSNADDFEAEAEQAVRKAVDEILAMEDRLFAEME